MTEKILIVIQARLGSRRLPRKVLADVDGSPLIAHVIERVQAIRESRYIVAAIPRGDEDLLRVLTSLHVDTITADEDDVLSRFGLAAQLHQAEIVVRITGDCPLFDPTAADEVIKVMQERPGLLYASNDTRVSGWPDGTDVEVFRRSVLDRAVSMTTLSSVDREHVTSVIRRWTHGGHIVRRPMDEVSSSKLSIDTAEDLEWLRQLWSASPLRGYTLRHTTTAMLDMSRKR
jgi:spore coat polysaccharide biosynthesis protein SpsF (cytidylyltransferase family)